MKNPWEKDMPVGWKHNSDKGKVIEAIDTHVRVAWDDGLTVTYDIREANENLKRLEKEKST